MTLDWGVSIPWSEAGPILRAHRENRNRWARAQRAKRRREALTRARPDGAAPPPGGGTPMAKLSAKQRDKIPSKNFAYVDDSGEGHLPINDAAHVRAAMGRFNQTHFEEPADKAKAARKIVSAAHSKGVEVAPDSAVAKAAKRSK